MSTYIRSIYSSKSVESTYLNSPNNGYLDWPCKYAENCVFGLVAFSLCNDLGNISLVSPLSGMTICQWTAWALQHHPSIYGNGICNGLRSQRVNGKWYEWEEAVFMSLLSSFLCCLHLSFSLCPSLSHPAWVHLHPSPILRMGIDDEGCVLLADGTWCIMHEAWEDGDSLLHTSCINFLLLAHSLQEVSSIMSIPLNASTSGLVRYTIKGIPWQTEEETQEPHPSWS